MLARRSWQTAGVPDVRDALHAARLYLVCGEQTDAFLEQALRGGVDIVQLRLKDASDETIVATARRYAAVCRAHGVPLILNDRPDLVAEAGADGVHVGQDDVAVPRGAGPGRARPDPRALHPLPGADRRRRGRA